MIPAKLVGQITAFPEPGQLSRLTDQAEDDKIRLLRKHQACAFVFPVDTNSQAILTLRFTDDAGLHWQVDDDLHLEQLFTRIW